MNTLQYPVRVICTIGEKNQTFEKDMLLPIQPQLKMELDLCVTGSEDQLETLVTLLRWDEKSHRLHVFTEGAENEGVLKALRKDPSWK